MDIDSILLFEDQYAKCFCSVFENEKVIRFRDHLIPDMYDHNYTRIKQVSDLGEVKLLIEQEIEFSISEGSQFCNIHFNGNVELPFVHELKVKPKETSYAIFATDNPSELRLRKRNDCEVEKISNTKMIEERLALELSEYGDHDGEDFCIRKAERTAQVYLSPGHIDAYLCRMAGIVVGKCDLFVEDGIAKIEDFDVSSAYQRKGFGTTIIHKLVSDAVKTGARTIYLVTDIDDTAKDMYAKLGFKEVAYKKQLFFELN